MVACNFDTANRRIATSDTKSDSPIWQATYGYDDAYRLTSFHATPPTRTFAPPPATKSYDSGNRLATNNGTPVASDPDGNLLQAPLNGTLLGNLTRDTKGRIIGTESEINNFLRLRFRKPASEQDSQRPIFATHITAAIEGVHRDRRERPEPKRSLATFCWKLFCW